MHLLHLLPKNTSSASCELTCSGSHSQIHTCAISTDMNSAYVILSLLRMISGLSIDIW